MEHLRFVCSIHIQLPVLLNDLLEMAFEHEATFQVSYTAIFLFSSEVSAWN